VDSLRLLDLSEVLATLARSAEDPDCQRHRARGRKKTPKLRANAPANAARPQPKLSLLMILRAQNKRLLFLLRRQNKRRLLMLRQLLPPRLLQLPLAPSVPPPHPQIELVRRHCFCAQNAAPR
jgi:hypothetical protein